MTLKCGCTAKHHACPCSVAPHEGGHWIITAPCSAAHARRVGSSVDYTPEPVQPVEQNTASLPGEHPLNPKR
jgi:hypothetical protein